MNTGDTGQFYDARSTLDLSIDWLLVNLCMKSGSSSTIYKNHTETMEELDSRGNKFKLVLEKYEVSVSAGKER